MAKASRTAVGLGLAVVCTVACGNDHAAPVADAARPAGDAPLPDAPPAPHAIVVTTGTIGEISIGTLTASPVASAVDLVSDPIVRHIGDQLVVLDRTVDSAGHYAVSLIDDRLFGYRYELFAQDAPQDVALVGDKIYVAELQGSGVVVNDRTDPATTIDLSADDPDGQPNCVSAFAVGTDVYVACALLDDTQPTQPPRGNGKIYVIDSTTDTVRTSFDLTTKNPTGLLEDVGDGTLAIATYDPTDGSGCIERIATGSAAGADGCIVQNVLLGGHATRLQFQPLDTSLFIWMAVGGMQGPNPQQLLAYDMSLGEMWPPISTPGEQISDVGLCPDGSLVLADTAAGSAGLRVYQLATEVTPAPLSIGAPPTSPHGIVCY
jgi:hypothetical protein